MFSSVGVSLREAKILLWVGISRIRVIKIKVSVYLLYSAMCSGEARGGCSSIGRPGWYETQFRRLKLATGCSVAVHISAYIRFICGSCALGTSAHA